MSRQRLPGLDGLRVLAVLAVFGLHDDKVMFPGGYVGVDVFFVLSGFVITGLLLRQSKGFTPSALSQFYRDRLWRLAPPLVVMVLAVSAVLPFTDEVGGLRMAPFALTYTADLFRLVEPAHESVFAHTWSLAIEEQFYLVWPLALALVCGRGASPRAIAWLASALAGLSCLISLSLSSSAGGATASLRIYNGPDTRAVQLLVGCALAGLVAAGPLPQWLRAVRSAAPIALTVLVLWVFLVPDTWANPRLWWVMPVVALATAPVVLLLATEPDHPVTAALGWRPLAWCGRSLSYGFYLWHYPVVLLLGPSLAAAPGTRLLVLFTVSAALSVVSWCVVERPLRARRRVSAVPAGASASPAG